MKSRSIKWIIFKYNILVILLFITLTTIIFNASVRIYMKNDLLHQLNKIAANTEDAALQLGPDFFPNSDEHPPFDVPYNNDVFKYYFMLSHSIKEPLSVLNADFILLNRNKDIINPLPEQAPHVSRQLMDQISNEVLKSKKFENDSYLNFSLSDNKYIAIVKPVSDKNSFGLGWIIIYSSLQKVNQLQLWINIILLSILIFSALIVVVFSSQLSKVILAPFSLLNKHIRSISERNFGTTLDLPVYDELDEFVNSINGMSQKLENYDKAQKTFLQNVSHEFRTPLMSIQSYAEGIKYEVVENDVAANVIIDETKRLTRLVEDLLYLSRLDAIEENYHYNNLDLKNMVEDCCERMKVIATKNNIVINFNEPSQDYQIYGDSEKISRAITNILSNCIQYTETSVTITIETIDKKSIRMIISDDGPGFDSQELENIFDRFYKGKKGNFGLGLSISKNIIEKHTGKITAKNSSSGAMFIIELPVIG